MPAPSAASLLPFLPAALLLFGALLIGLAGRFLPSRWPATTVTLRVLPAVSVLAALFVIAVRYPSSDTVCVLLDFPPGFGANLSLWGRFDAWGRLFGLLLLWPGLAAVAADLIAPLKPDFWLRWLLLLAAAHLALAAADWFTLAAALLLFDLVRLGIDNPRLASDRAFMVNALGGLAILAAGFVLLRGGFSPNLVGSEPIPAAAAWLIAGAAIVRMAPYPLHLWLAGALQEPLSAWQWPLRLSSSVLGLYLFTRILALAGSSLPGTPWMLMAGAAGCLMAALLAWLTVQQEPGRAIPYIGLYTLGLAVLGWTAPGQPFWGFGSGLCLLLGVTALAAHREKIAATAGETPGQAHWLSGGVAAAALAGLPLTAGFFVRLPLYSALLSRRLIAGLLVLLIAEGLAAAVLLRLWAGSDPGFAIKGLAGVVNRDGRGWAPAVILIAPLLLLGAFPSLAVSLAGLTAVERAGLSWPIGGQLAEAGIGLWAALLLPWAAGYGIYRSDPFRPAEMAEAKEQWLSLLRLEWLHRAADKALGQARQALWSMGAILHGEGYLAWAMLSLLLIFILVLGR